MPTIPTYDNFRTEPSIPEGRFDANAVNAGQLSLGGRMEEQAGARLEQQGQQTLHAGNQMLEYAIHAQQQANQVRLVDARNKVEAAKLTLTFDPQAGYANLKGEAALAGQDGRPLADVYADKLKAVTDSVSESLGNETQRAMFGEFASHALAGFHAEVMHHAVQQQTSYAISTYQGGMKLDMDGIAANWNNPEKVDQHIQAIRAGSYELSKLQGKSPLEGEADAKDITSKAHMQAISAAIQANNIPYADGYLKKYASQMNAADILKVQGVITKEQDSQVALGTVNQVISQAMPRLVPNDFGRMVNITLGSESGGHRYDASGGLLTSPKGAKGEMQVLDGTNRDPGYGVRPAQNDSPEERARVGRDYLQAMLQHYNGDPAKAWAAYNGGPGTLDKALKAAGASPNYGNRPDGTPKGTGFLGELKRPDGKVSTEISIGVNIGGKEMDIPTLVPTLSESQKQWLLTHDPSEKIPQDIVQVAVDHAKKRLAEGKSVYADAPQTSGDWLSHLPAETQAYVAKNMKAFNSGGGKPTMPSKFELEQQALSDPAVANHPERQRLVQAQIDHQYTAIQQGIKQQEESAMADAYSWLAQNAGNYAAMPANLKAAVPAKELDNLMSYSGKMAAGVPVQTNWELYAKLYGNQDKLVKANLPAFRNQLGDTEFKQLVERQDKLKNSPDTDASYLQSEDQYIDTMLNQGGIHTTPETTPDWERLGRARNMLQQDVSTAEHEAGRKLKRGEKDEIISQTITRMLGKVNVTRDNWWDKKDVPLIDLDEDDRAKAYPTDKDRKAIIANLAIVSVMVRLEERKISAN